MTITLPDDLEREMARRAHDLGLSPEELVRRAVAWFVQVDPELQAELREWQRTGWHAWDVVEESLQ